MSTVSLTPVANLPLVSLIPAAFAASIVATVSTTPAANSPLVLLILVVHLYLRISPQIFE
jgi:hypothetical protein